MNEITDISAVRNVDISSVEAVNVCLSRNTRKNYTKSHTDNRPKQSVLRMCGYKYHERKRYENVGVLSKQRSQLRFSRYGRYYLKRKRPLNMRLS